MRCTYIGRFILFALLATDVRAGGTTPQKKLWADVRAGQAVYRADEVKRVEIYFVLFNDGREPIDPRINSSSLIINGEPMKKSMMMFGNGPRDRRWDMLPAGDYLQFGYNFRENPAFNSPGTYTIQWKGDGFKSRVAEFRILPPVVPVPTP